MSKLKLKTVLGFSVGDLGGNLYFSIIGFIFIFYLTEHLGLSGTLAGVSMMIGKIWDAITDPIVSTISDRSTSRWGRRRPFIFWGALILSITMVIMFSLPKFGSDISIFINATIIFCILSTAYTLVNIPYASLQPELTDDYHEKTRLTSVRMSFAIFGTITAASARPIAYAFGVDSGGWTYMAIIMGSIILVSSWITVFTVKENDKAQAEQKGIKTSYKEALNNIEFLLALIPWTLFVAGVTIIQGAYLYYFKYIFKNPSLFDITLFGLIFLSLASLPLWVKISRKVNKKNCYIYGMFILITALISSYFLAPVLGPVFTVVILITSGIGFSTHYIMPHSIIPDIVELDAARTGIRREGVYYSIWNFAMKCGQAFAGLLIGISLDLFGFIPPDAGSDLINEQSSHTLNGISFLCGPTPVIFILTGVIILRKYPIDNNYYIKELNRERKK